MPRATKPNAPANGRWDDPRNRWAMENPVEQPQLSDWDIKSTEFWDAIAAIADSGATVVIRPGSGRRSIGLSIWDGDTKNPPVWVYDSEELDTWSAKIIRIARKNGEKAAE